MYIYIYICVYVYILIPNTIPIPEPQPRKIADKSSPTQFLEGVKQISHIFPGGDPTSPCLLIFVVLSQASTSGRPFANGTNSRHRGSDVIKLCIDEIECFGCKGVVMVYNRCGLVYSQAF